MPFDQEDISTWTHQRVKLHVESSKRKLKSFYQNFFGWSEDEYKEAKEHAVAELRKHFNLTKKFPTIGPQAKLRHTVQTNLVRDWPDLFVNRHGSNPPAWFDAELISRPPPPSHTRSFDMKNVVQQFISLSRGHQGRHLKRDNRAQDDGNDEEDDDDDEDDEDDDSYRVLHKRPRISMVGTNTLLGNSASTSMRSSPYTAATSPRASADMEPPDVGSNSGRDGKASSRIATTSRGTIRASNPLGLILYITRVTIVDQVLVLERDRFGLVENLFERGRLIESYIQELVFGNPLYNKPTFLWFFDDTSEDKPRSINNRPSAEVAIIMLRARAERAGATGIQLFDAPECETAALVPVHEVDRKDDFVQRVSFELEIDNGDVDHDDGGGDVDVDTQEEAEMASRMDSAYESRDGELQLDDVVVKKECESKPNITWAGQQQQQQEQENKIESDSESEEEEGIGRFYR
jgi:hypothetical protein